MITNELIYTELVTIKKQLAKLLRKNSVEEISLNRACRRMHIGYDTIMELIRLKKIIARPINSKHSKNGISYKIKISSIEDYQSRPDVDLRIVEIKSIPQLIKEAL